MKKILFLFLFLVPSISLALKPADDVFKLEVLVKDPSTLMLEFRTEEGYFIYQDRIKVWSDGALLLGNISWPKALNKTDKLGRINKIYRKKLTLALPILPTKPSDYSIHIDYQGCSDEGVCYPPVQTTWIVSIDPLLNIYSVTKDNLPSPIVAKIQSKLEVYDDIFEHQNFTWVLLAFFGFGLLLAFTPCILPVIPVLSSLIVGHDKHMSSKKGLFLSLFYVLSMSVTYAIIGAIIALLGENLQVVLQTPWAISIFALIFILLALSMFDFYQLRLPVALQAKIAAITRSQSGGHYLGAIVMGALSTLILSPCVTAPLLGVLGYIAQTGNVLFGSIALFCLSLGMGFPLILFGLSAGRLLPKAGAWMNEIKYFFGLILLALAIFVLSRILPSFITMTLWASLLIFTGAYLGPFNKTSNKLEKFNQALAIILILYGILIFIGATLGNEDPLKPLYSNKNERIVGKNTVFSMSELQNLLQQNKGKPIVLDYYASWCSNCKALEKTLLKNSEVLALFEEIVLIRVDITELNENSKALMQAYQVIAPPTFIFIGEDGEEKVNLREVGDTSVNEFKKKLQELL